jgi:hypothetical protein
MIVVQHTTADAQRKLPGPIHRAASKLVAELERGFRVEWEQQRDLHLTEGFTTVEKEWLTFSLAILSRLEARLIAEDQESATSKERLIVHK